jgi:hypothetical protein
VSTRASRPQRGDHDQTVDDVGSARATADRACCLAEFLRVPRHRATPQQPGQVRVWRAAPCLGQDDDWDDRADSASEGLLVQHQHVADRLCQLVQEVVDRVPQSGHVEAVGRIVLGCGAVATQLALAHPQGEHAVAHPA